jgi:hypothetical protein
MASSSTFDLAQFTRIFYETRPQRKLFTVKSVVDYDDDVSKAFRNINDRLLRKICSVSCVEDNVEDVC